MNRTKSILSIWLIILSGLNSLLISQQKWADPSNIGILNSKYDEFAPSWNSYENKLYFNSDRTSFSLFYTSQISESFEFSKPSQESGGFNQAKNNQSYISFLTETKAVFSSYRQGLVRPFVNLFYSEKKKQAWSKGIILDSLSNDCFTGQASISPDGTFMIFVSDFQNEHKDTDLWMASLKENGTWGSISPINELNTNGNEITPFLADKDTLYFSSDGQEGPGGFDIYYSVLKDGLWSKPLPVSELNTQFNESDLIMLPGGQCLFASDKPGGSGKLDLYSSVREDIKKLQDIVNTTLDINLASQVSIVRTNADLSYKLMPAVPVYQVQANNNHFLLPNEFVISSIEPKIDSIIAFSLPVIAKRALDNPESKLFIQPYYLNEEEIPMLNQTLSKIKRYFFSDWSLDSNRFTVLSPQKAEQNIANSGSRIIFSADSASIFEPLPIGNFKIELDPPVLDLNLNARPTAFVKKWECNLFVNNKFIKTTNQGTVLPASFSIDLNPVKNELAEADSIRLSCSVQDTLGRMYYKTMNLNISHSINKSKEFTKIGNMLFDEYYLYLINDNFKSDNNYYTKSIESISSSGSYSAKVIIYYYSPLLKESAVLLSDVLRKMINEDKIPVEMIEAVYTDDLPFDSQLSAKVLRIMIEKQIVN